MPELPDIVLYCESLDRRLRGATVHGIRVVNPNLLRTADPPLSAATGRTVRGMRRLGKRLVFALDDELFLVVHLMIAGRLRWKQAGAKLPGKLGSAAFDFDAGTLILTEAGTKKRASLHLLQGEAALAALDPGGLEVLDCTAAAFAARVRAENHTIKRSLTDPRILSGIGNAYSDEILHRARLSPMALTQKMSDEACARLFDATQACLREWTARLRTEAGETFPEHVTAFRPDFAVHGRFGQPCPVCGSAVQRIRYADNETNYCATCQTGGTVLADRALSRLLRGDWPRTLAELEELRRG